MSRNYTKHDCIWLEYDTWCHATQCLLHAKKYEPEMYNTGNPEDESPVSGHPCVMRDGCGFCVRDKDKPLSAQRLEVKPATSEEMADWHYELDVAQLKYLETHAVDVLKRIAELRARVKAHEEKKEKKEK